MKIIKKNDLSLYYNLFDVKTQKNILNLKTSFRLISHYKNNLVFAQDYLNLHVCCLQDNIFTSVYKFDFNNSKICVLKSGDLIVLGETQYEIKEKGEDGNDFSYHYTIKFFDYYKRL